MTLGGNLGPNNEVTIRCEPNGGYLILSPSEFHRFKQGETISKRSGDARGEFTITVQLKYKYPIHNLLAMINSFIEEEGTAKYKGYVILADSNGYDVFKNNKKVGYAERVNDAIHQIDEGKFQ